MIDVNSQDIPYELAYNAHRGTSFVPEKRAESAQSEYAATLTADYAALEKIADTPEKLALLDTEFERYRAGYRRKTLDYLGSRNGMVSTMIAGPSGFPAARMNKKSESIHRRLTELIEYRERALEAIRKKLCPGLRPIMAGDADAVDRLADKIAEAEKLQHAMREANKIIRKAPKYKPTDEKIAAITALGLSESRARQLFDANYMGTVGFEHFELSNNNANIRRMKERLAQISRNREAENVTIEGENVRLEDCPAENRVRLFFPGKPAADIRSRLKSCGFRWAPSIGCWQAYRNTRTIETAKAMV